MKKYIWFLVFSLWLMAAGALAQSYMETKDIWNQLGHEVTDSDSIYYSSGIVIVGDETLNIYIPVKKTNGVVSIWGYTYSNSGASADSVYFYVAPHRGTSGKKSAYFTPAYVVLDTAIAAIGSTGQYDVYPMSSSTLKAKGCNYYDLKITGTANKTRSLYMKIEWIEQ